MERSVFLLLDHYPQMGERLGESYAFALDHARLADKLGFEALWLAEHHFQHLGTTPNPAVMLAAVATQTSRLRIGPAVSVLPYRNPVLVAEDYALVDVLSGGRLNMGVGCGSQRVEFDELGMDFNDRRDTYYSNLITLRELWSGTKLNVTPHQHPTPPIYVATTNEDSARNAGRNGDSVITLLSPATSTLGDLARLLEAHRKGLGEGDHSQDDAEVVVAQLAHVAQSDERARAHTIPALSRFLSMLSTDGSQAELVYDSMQRSATGCFGSPTDAQEIVSRLENEGVRHVAFITQFGNMDSSAAHSSLRLLAPATEHIAPVSSTNKVEVDCMVG